MGYKVTISPVNIEFTVETQENILHEALTAKINLPHGCKNGACAACKCKLIKGEVSLDTYSQSALSNAEAANGYVLLCKAHAKSDIIIELPGFVNSFPIRTLPAKIESIEKIGSVAILKLRLPANQQFEFYAGQYIDIIYNGSNRSYSLANSPTEKGIIELHIRYRCGGAFSEAVWHNLQPKQLLRFTGPLGNFTLKDTDKPILMVCTGTGFAPIKAILEYMIATDNQRAVHLVWGNYTADDFYHTELLPLWQQKLTLQVTQCINSGSKDNYYVGLVTDYVVTNFPDLSNYEVYACGNLAMIESLYSSASTTLRLEKTNFFSDAFTPSF